MTVPIGTSPFSSATSAASMAIRMYRSSISCWLSSIMPAHQTHPRPPRQQFREEGCHFPAHVFYYRYHSLLWLPIEEVP